MDVSRTQLYSNICGRADALGVISFVGSLPDDQLIKLYYGGFEKATKSAIKHQKAGLLRLAPKAGWQPLRDVLNPIVGAETLVTSGSQQALDLLAEVLFQSNETVLIEPLTYIGIETPFRNRGIRAATFTHLIIELSDEEIIREIKKNHPTAIYVVPYFANPTGDSITRETLIRLRTLAQENDFYLIEDQTYGWYAEMSDFPLRDALNPRVIQIGSISKLIGAGLRIGWIGTQNQELLARLAECKAAKDLAVSTLDQSIAANMLAEEKQMLSWRIKTQEHYRRKLEILINALDNYMPKSFEWRNPKGGTFIWVRGSAEFDAWKFYEAGLAKGAAVVPGRIFAFDSSGENAFRLAFSTTDIDQIETGIVRLSSAL